MRIVRQTFHTFVTAILPVAVLVFRHIPRTPLTAATVLRPTVVIFAATLTLLIMSRPLIPNLQQRAIALTVFFFLLPFYPLFATAIGWYEGWRALTVAGFYTAACVIVAAVTARRWSTDGDVALLNIVACAVCLAVAVHLLVMARPWSPAPWHDAVETIQQAVLREPLERGARSPDVYYIVLDGMLRPDLTHTLYHVETNWFEAELRDRRFTVGSRTRSNYAQTLLSLASSLNASYLDGVARVMANTADRRPLDKLIQTSAVIRQFRRLGYEFVMIGSDAPGTVGHDEADRCYCGLVRGISEFEMALLLGSPGAALRVDSLSYGAHRRKIAESFSAVEQVRRVGRPMFVLAHVLVPHPPFVFNADGSARVQSTPFALRDGTHYPGGRTEYAQGYAQQVGFVMRRVLHVIDSIDEKGGEPVIVLQGDHGSGLGLDWDSAERSDTTERLGILAALRVPANSEIPDDLTPVNVFRLVFNQLFGGRFPILPNRSYFSGWYEPYRFIEVPP
jgi:hypothetical protein